MRKATGNHVALFFPIYDMDVAILLKDNGVNKGISKRAGRVTLSGEWCKAFSVVIQRIPYSKTRVRRKK